MKFTIIYPCSNLVIGGLVVKVWVQILLNFTKGRVVKVCDLFPFHLCLNPERRIDGDS